MDVAPSCRDLRFREWDAASSAVTRARDVPTVATACDGQIGRFLSHYVTSRRLLDLQMPTNPCVSLPAILCVMRPVALNCAMLAPCQEPLCARRLRARDQKHQQNQTVPPLQQANSRSIDQQQAPHRAIRQKLAGVQFHTAAL